MCGIFGAIETAQRVDAHVLRVLNDSMRARGPDGEGHFLSRCGRVGMAMRRLSIIDLEGGWQPLFSEDGQIVAMQNGEIYNHRELRRRLEQSGHHFQTRSDTEVLVHGYEQWGIRGLLDRLDGMFALAIADVRKRQLHLARDRFGEKPLYYHAENGRLVYSSQLLTAAAYPGVEAAWDPAGLNWYLALHFVPGDGTVWRGLRKLQPGHFLTVDWDSAKYSIQRYWRLRESRDRDCDTEEILAAVDQAVQSRLVADVPVGLFLSGGLDSSVLAALAVRHTPRLATFSMGFAAASHDESPFAQQVAAHLGTRHHHFEFGDDAFRELLPHVVAGMDEPVGDQAMLPLYWLCREAAREVTVVLSGEGADELFGGYSYYPQASGLQRPGLRQRMRNWLRRDTGLALLQSNGSTPSGFPLLMGESERRKWLGCEGKRDYGRWYSRMLGGWGATQDPLRRACLADVETWLAEDLLMKLDKMAMANSLEGRAPYLCHRLAQMAFDLPANRKLTDNANKIGLREVAGRLLPPNIADRRKQGFVLPMRKWLANYLSSESADGLVSAAKLDVDSAVLQIFLADEERAGVVRDRLTYAVIVLAKWAVHARERVRDLRSALLGRTVRAA
jgi:asparagine synthase (glutamine-hydrolysing)